MRIRGLGSKDWFPRAPDRRWLDERALSESDSMKSLTIKSRLEKVSSVKVGPLSKMDRRTAWRVLCELRVVSGMIAASDDGRRHGDRCKARLSEIGHHLRIWCSATLVLWFVAIMVGEWTTFAMGLSA